MKLAAWIIAMSVAILFIWGDSTMWEDDTYAVYYIDGDIKLGMKMDDEGSFLGRVNNVIAVGSNDKYVVVQQLTSSELISYVFLDKKKDNVCLDSGQVIEGPYTEPQFKELSKKLSLPKFTKEF